MKTKLILKPIITTVALTLIMTFNASAFTAVISGAWSNAATWGGIAPTGTVSGQDIIIPSGITVTMDTDVSFSGVLNNFTVNGVMNGSAYNLTMVQGSFSGSGMVNIHKISFTNLLATMSYTGTLNVDEFDNNGAALSLAAVVNVADTLHLTAGSIALNTGANLTTLSNSTIKIDNGSMSVSGGIFTSSNNYNVMYVGTNKTSGVELNSSTIQNLYVNLNDNTQVVVLAGNLVINGDFYHTRGRLSIGSNSLTIAGNMFKGPGVMLAGISSSDLTFTGINPPVQSITFISGSSLNKLEVNYSGAGELKLSSPIDVTGSLNLNKGKLSLGSGSTLTMAAGSTVHIEDGMLQLDTGTFNGVATYNVEYMGGSMNTGIELSGAGLNNITINLPVVSNIIILNSDLTVTGNLMMVKGKLNIFNSTLSVNGLLSQTADAPFVGTANSELELNMTSAMGDTIYFHTGYQQLSSLRVNVGGDDIVLGTDLIIYDELDMTSGRLDINNHMLTIASTGAITNFDDNNYIIAQGSGKLIMHVNSAGPYVTFPIGTYTNYSPAYVQQTASGTSGNFHASVMSGVYTNGTTGFNSALTESLVNRTWLIEEESGVSVNTNIKLGWKAAAEVNGFDRTSCYISHYNGGMWDAQAPAAASTGSFSTYEITRLSLATLSPFAVADDNAVLETEELAMLQEGIVIYPNPSRDYVFVENANYINDFKYEVVDVTGKVIMAVDIANKGDRHVFDVTKLINGYYFIRATNLNTKEIITKRFIKG
ncbi:MAG TPA: T9SS type A sorting domain-containing protein [Flavobacteriales bacterium]|nr:T9SS type A sorting domain-containing protein [Flavobacteriales bacterium]